LVRSPRTTAQTVSFGKIGNLKEEKNCERWSDLTSKVNKIIFEEEWKKTCVYNFHSVYSFLFVKHLFAKFRRR
jgi:hypothetical protein